MAGTGPERILCHPQASYRVGLTVSMFIDKEAKAQKPSDSSVAIVLGSGRAMIQIQVSLAPKLMPLTIPLYCP